MAQSSPTRIRLAGEADLAGLAEFARATFSEAFGQDVDRSVLQQHLEEQMSDSRFASMMAQDVFYLACSGDQLSGFVQLGDVAPSYGEHADAFDPAAGEIRRLYVRRELQGRGIGSALLRRALDDDRLCGRGRVYLTTWHANLGAQRLYTRWGFSKVGQIPEFARDGSINGYEHIMVRSVSG